MLISVFGKRGSGKTTIIRGNIEYFPGPVVIIDALGNFPKEEYPMHFTSISELINNLEYYARSIKNDPKKENELDKIFVIQTPDVDSAVELISATLWEVSEKYGIGGTLVLDEVDMFTYSKGSCLDQLVRYGRNKGIHLLTGCRRPAELSRNFTAGANKIYIFRTQEPRDIDYFKAGLLGDRAESLMSLPSYHGLLIDYDRNELCNFYIDIDGKVNIIKSTPLEQS